MIGANLMTRVTVLVFGLALVPLSVHASKTRMIYKFQSGTDGANPLGDLIEVDGKLYGTTYNGGASANCTGGCGTVFAVTVQGDETVVHAFAGGADGANPSAGLIEVGGTFLQYYCLRRRLRELHRRLRHRVRGNAGRN
jgi:uncharacterized repeat protein (TIGR03803 family)